MEADLSLLRRGGRITADALAEREGCELVTADQKSINNLAPHFPFIVPLTSLP
jgi:hypothetical protein